MNYLREALGTDIYSLSQHLETELSEYSIFHRVGNSASIFSSLHRQPKEGTWKREEKKEQNHMNNANTCKSNKVLHNHENKTANDDFWAYLKCRQVKHMVKSNTCYCDLLRTIINSVWTNQSTSCDLTSHRRAVIGLSLAGLARYIFLPMFLAVWEAISLNAGRSYLECPAAKFYGWLWNFICFWIVWCQEMQSDVLAKSIKLRGKVVGWKILPGLFPKIPGGKKRG